jgi:antitoxin MazE
MSTAIAQWGNSDAVRIPADKLRRVGLRRGDLVEVAVNQQGHLEIIPIQEAHRRIVPREKVSFEELFKGYSGGRLDNSHAWPDEEMVGAETDAWSS